MTLIDNKDQTLQDALKNALEGAERIDISVGFFYFSGFQALADQLKDKKVRILVGLQVDPNLVPQITQKAKEGDVDLTKYQIRDDTESRTELKNNYIDSFVAFMNDSDIFDDEKENKIFELYLEKINDGTLEIRKTRTDHHEKYYLIHNSQKNSQGGDFPGTGFMGSSNFTYRGLVGQGELNEPFRDKSRFTQYESKFEELWRDSESISIVDKNSKEDFLNIIKPRIWKYVTPSPYEIYIRILHELFYQEENNSIITPQKITNGLYTDLEYQVDAIKMVLDKLDKHDGAILADVVGLGKSIIASAVARNLDIKTIIIAPPHLIPQWEDYKEQFGIRGSKVFSSGKIKEVYDRYYDSQDPLLIILDEAHRYRNEDTNDYKLLHQICRSNKDNKVLLLTATPFNNDPKDVFALIKLFQTPGQSTIKSVDNLSLRYRELIQRYKKLRRDLSKRIDIDVEKETDEIAAEQRRLIETIIIRRSRLDLNYITRYREDLEKQNINFADVQPPEAIEYNLGNLFDLYKSTLDSITQSDNEGFIGARYKPTTYMSEDNRKKFLANYKDELDETDLQTAQTNLAKFMRRLLVMRFESSKEAFRLTLDKIISSNEKIEHWWEIGSVPILKKGQLPDPQDFEDIDSEDGEVDIINKELELLRENKGFIDINKEMIEPQFIEDVMHDTKLLKSIYQQWYGGNSCTELDPKLDEIENKIKIFLKENPDRKIIIFSSYKDTVDYLYEELKKRGYNRVAKYTASESSNNYKQIIKLNFDASIPEHKQVHDYDVLIATDALSEGFNLHRAGIVINYDIPYNPTRVIQRIGRINRINKKVFDNLYVYNCFPTSIGESETRIKLISTLKIKLINAVVGSDTQTLTKEEELKSYFKDEFNKAREQDEALSWDAIHREVYEKALCDERIMREVNKLPHRSRVKREDSKKIGVVVFGKKGQNTVFTFGNSSHEAQIISTEDALPYFEAKQDEKGIPVCEDFINTFNLAKEKLFAKHELPQIKGRRLDAINLLKLLSNSLPQAKDYCDDIILIIKTLDDISDGALKDISQLNIKDEEKAYQELKKIIPESHIKNILNRAKRDVEAQELLLFAEQLE